MFLVEHPNQTTPFIPWETDPYTLEEQTESHGVCLRQPLRETEHDYALMDFVLARRFIRTFSPVPSLRHIIICMNKAKKEAEFITVLKSSL